jgi:hypothetical protein
MKVLAAMDLTVAVLNRGIQSQQLIHWYDHQQWRRRPAAWV